MRIIVSIPCCNLFHWSVVFHLFEYLKGQNIKGSSISWKLALEGMDLISLELLFYSCVVSVLFFFIIIFLWSYPWFFCVKIPARPIRLDLKSRCLLEIYMKRWGVERWVPELEAVVVVDSSREISTKADMLRRFDQHPAVGSTRWAWPLNDAPGATSNRSPSESHYALPLSLSFILIPLLFFRCRNPILMKHSPIGQHEPPIISTQLPRCELRLKPFLPFDWL